MRVHFGRLRGPVGFAADVLTLIVVGGELVAGIANEAKKHKNEKTKKTKIQDAEVTIVESEDQNEESNK